MIDSAFAGRDVPVSRSRARASTSEDRTPFWLAMLIWIVVLTSFASFRSRTEMELWDSGGMDAQVKFQAATWVVLGCLAAIFVVSGRADLGLLKRGSLFWFSAFTGLAVLSTAVSDSPTLTLFRSMQLAIGIVLVVSLREHLSKFYWFALVYLGINWVLFLIGLFGLHGGQQWLTGLDGAFLINGERVEGATWRLETAFGHPSIISIVAAVTAVGLAARTQGRDWLKWGPVIAWVMLILLLTISRTAIVGALGGLVVVAIGKRMFVPMVLAAGVALPLLMFPAEVQERASKYFMRGQTRQEFQSLSGRSDIYAEVLARASDNWHTGLGFASSRKHLIGEEGDAGITHSHNSLLEALSASGVAGAFTAFLVLATWLGALWTIWWRRADWQPSDASLGLELCAMFVPVVAFCILDRGFVSENNAFVMQFLAMLALTTQLMQRHESASVSRREQSAGASPRSRVFDRRAAATFGRGGDYPSPFPGSAEGDSP